MRAALLRDGAMVVDDLPDLVPTAQQVLVEPIACGICGSDLHTVDHAHELVETAKAAGAETFSANFDPNRDLVMGHEVSLTMGASQAIDPRSASLSDAWRAAGEGITPPVIYDAVGVPGMIDNLMQEAPERSQILVAGVCMPPDTIRPFLGIAKRLNLQFVLGWTPENFVASLHDLAEGRIDGSKLISGEVGLDGVPQAFADLADPDRHVKILVRPDL